MHNAEHASNHGQSRSPATSVSAGLRRRWAVPISVTTLVVILDQWTKWQVREWLGPGHPSGEWSLLGGWLGFDYVENSGAAFGTLAGMSGWLTIGALVVVAVAAGLYARLANPSALIQVGLGLLIGGALGNIIDRVALGYVVDFVAVGPWPRFNLADSAVTVGVVLLLWELGRPPSDPH